METKEYFEKVMQDFNQHRNGRSDCHIPARNSKGVEEVLYGVDIPKNVWHNVECLESGSVFFECKEGPFSRLASSTERPGRACAARGRRCDAPSTITITLTGRWCV